MSIVDAATGALVGGVPRVEAETVAWGHDGQSLGAVGAWRASASGEGPGGRRITWLSVDGAGSWRESQTWELPSDDVSELARLTVAPDRGAWAA